MKSSDKIEHQGVIKEMGAGKIKVAILNASACALCHAKSFCSLPDVQEKIIEVPHAEGNFSVGDHVTVIFEKTMGFQAVFLGYVLPFLLVLLTLFLASAVIHREVIAGLVALSVLLPYYLILYFFRAQIKTLFKFKIKE